jgi:hypothetical protein
MSKMGEAGLTATLREIRNMIKEVSNDVSEIKKMLGLTNKLVSEKKDSSVYPWHLPNVTTTADYGEED